MQKKKSTHLRISPETKELLDKIKIIPEESYDKVIKRVLSGSKADNVVTNIDGRTPLEEEAYKSQMKLKVVK